MGSRLALSFLIYIYIYIYICWRSHCQIFKLSLCYLSNWRGGGIITDCENVKFIFFICVFVYGGLLQTPERK